MDKKSLDKRIFDYYLHYYRDICCIKKPEKRASFRVGEEANEEKRIAELKKITPEFFTEGKKHFIVGAGTGGLAVVLKEKYHCQVSGLEPDSEALSIIKEKCLLNNIPQENFRKEFCENIFSPDNSYDFIHCFTVLEHVKDISKSLNEMIRITKPGGKIYINTPNYAYPYEGHYKIPFPTFLPKIFGYLYLIILGKSPKFLKTINFITEKQLDDILKKKNSISWIRIKKALPKSHGRLGWLLNYLKFKKNIYPTQEIIITKENPEITILIVNYNTSAFIKNTLFCLQKLTFHPYQVFILDNNSRLNDWKNLQKITATELNVFIERKETKLTGSLAHGTALNYLIKKVNTPYLSILDADAIWLKKHWDEILIKHLDEKIKIIGTQSDSPTKPRDFPAVYGLLADANIFKRLEIDMRPDSLLQNQDTGWKIKEKFLSAGLKGLVLNMENTRQFKTGPFYSFLGVGEYYHPEFPKLPFASHFGRGSSLGKAKYLKTWAKPLFSLPLIGNFMLKIKGRRDRNKWFKICRQLVNQQNSNIYS